MFWTCLIRCRVLILTQINNLMGFIDIWLNLCQCFLRGMYDNKMSQQYDRNGEYSTLNTLYICILDNVVHMQAMWYIIHTRYIFFPIHLSDSIVEHIISFSFFFFSKKSAMIYMLKRMIDMIFNYMSQLDYLIKKSYLQSNSCNRSALTDVCMRMLASV